MGSIRFITDSVGEIVNAYVYDAYGRPGFTLEAIDQPFRYTGREYDEATELYHYRARQYDPETGRFLQEDKLSFDAGDLNVYRYVQNNPLIYKDSTGKIAETAILAGDRSATLAPPIKKVGDSLNCLFGAIASAIKIADIAAGKNVVDIDVDIQNCGAALISGVAPAFSDDPVTDSAELAKNTLFQVAIVKFLKGALPKKLSVTIFPTATPAYPSTWRNR